ncbi:Sensor histidine kinase [Rubrivivax sp. A210]|uniref:sensor histidine kinase n=1 Tax=Rubrivivax sp. A210 TaxID=2772301 RepID=UPI001917D31F|nr:HAMP domain-containing sensor histidine kinase [Rubrivivax sp. A210]CAD5369715.1 Sensor histidine kinase [Rubrivivax sp. A210]
MFDFRAPKPAPARRFALVRYFSLTGLTAFVLVALVLTHFTRQQGQVYRDIQSEEAEHFRAVQHEFAQQQEAAALRDLLAVHESGHVNLARLFANALWQSDIAPFAERAAGVPLERCRTLPEAADAAKAQAAVERATCFAEVGRRILALPGYDALNAKVFAAMSKSTVFKVKVFDLRGVTVYSSERQQVGEDKSANAGWVAAAAGQPRSELTHRDKFSAFEGVVEKRDLISSYLPVWAPGSQHIVGVFEVYSDVTPLLDQIRLTSAKIEKAATANQDKVAQMSARNEGRVAQTSQEAAFIIAGSLLLLFGVLYLIVKHADGILAVQAQERERTHQDLAQAEKMASLGQMVAGVAHQLNTPIAYSHNNVGMAIEALKEIEPPLSAVRELISQIREAPGDYITLDIERERAQLAGMEAAELSAALPLEMLGDTLGGLEQMRELVDHLRDFTRLDRSRTAQADLAKVLHNVAYIARSVLPGHIRIVEKHEPLAEIDCNVSQLNQVFMNLINNAAQAIGQEAGTISVRSRMDHGKIRISVADTGPGIAPDVLPHIWDTYFTTKPEGEGTGLGLPIARTIVEQHGGKITVVSKPGRGTTFTVRLPVAAEPPAPELA